MRQCCINKTGVAEYSAAQVSYIFGITQIYI